MTFFESSSRSVVVFEPDRCGKPVPCFPDQALAPCLFGDIVTPRHQNKKQGAIMPVTTQDKRATFRKMHESGCFAIPNPWDVGSALALQHLGFKALASTSAGFAWSIVKADNRVSLDVVCTHLTALCAAVDLPVNADFEGGFAHEAEKVAINVARGVKTGVAPFVIEGLTAARGAPLDCAGD